jgi:hypothetical protein
VFVRLHVVRAGMRSGNSGGESLIRLKEHEIGIDGAVW